MFAGSHTEHWWRRFPKTSACLLWELLSIVSPFLKNWVNHFVVDLGAYQMAEHNLSDASLLVQECQLRWPQAF